MQETIITNPQMSQVTATGYINREQKSMDLFKGIAVIVAFTALFAAIGLFIGTKFFWNNYSKETAIEHEYRMNLENVKNDTNNPNNHLNLGWTYLKMGENEQAVGEFKKALSLDPKNYGANLNLGLAYIQLEAYDNAIIAIKKAIDINPDTYTPHLNLALSYYHVGRYDEALSELDRAYQYNPGAPDTMNVRGMVYEKQNRLQEALDQYNTALSFNPEDQAVQAAVDRVTQAMDK